MATILLIIGCLVLACAAFACFVAVYRIGVLDGVARAKAELDAARRGP